jgi:hypothetical protein
MLPDRVTQHRLALKHADFAPLPLHNKECHLVGWPTKTLVTDNEIISWQSLAASRNTGLLTKSTPALDIDILNPDAADAVEKLIRQWHGELLVRTGLPPKRLIPFRTDTPFSKISIKFIDTKERLEFLGDGQQFVAFGTHPDTMQSYTWRGGEPGTTPRSALPLINEQDALELINAAADLLVTRFGYRRPAQGCSTQVVSDPLVVANLTEALRQMDPVDWNGEWDRWFQLLMGCKFVGISLADFIEWSTRDPDYANDAGEIARQWRSVEPRHGGAFYAALKAKGIKVTNPSGSPFKPSSTINWWTRFNSVLNKLRAKQDGDMLFWAGCKVAEIMADTGKPTPSVAIDLLASAVSPAIKRDEAVRVIGNAFDRAVTAKTGTQIGLSADVDRGAA